MLGENYLLREILLEKEVVDALLLEVGWGFEQPGLVRDIPAHGGVVLRGARLSLKGLSNLKHSMIL